MRKLTVRKGYALFWGSWPSNWEHSPFTVGADRYNCVEQYMMAEKARLFGDEEVLAKIMASPYPKAQKEFGRKVRGFSEAKWENVRYEVVLRGTLEKYRQNDELRALLLGTVGTVKEFVEASPEDKIWGIGLGKDDPRATDPEQWLGLNLLGKAITEARDVIVKEFG